MTKSDGTDAIINQTYTYYNDGLLAQMTDAVETTAGCGYNYDDFNRLAQVMASNGTTSIGGYSYDKWGNMTSASSVSAPIPAYSLSYAKDGSNVPLTNRLQSATAGGNTISYSYDAAGNLTQEGTTSYSYDAANRLREVGTGGFNTYGYDGDGKRVRKVEGGGQPLFYVWSSVLGQVMLEVNSENVQRAYVYAGGKLIALLSYDGEFYWSHPDRLGSGKKLTDSTGAVRYRGEFDPFGQTISEWSSPAAVSKNTHKFTGYERDATGLDNANARMYHPNRGRFMQPDPAGLSAINPNKPQSLNRYSYTENDPVNHADPSGLNDYYVGTCDIGFLTITITYTWTDSDGSIIRRESDSFFGIVERCAGGISSREPVNGGGGGGNQDPFKALPSYDETAAELFSKFLDENPDCATEINALATAAGINGNFRDAFRNTKFYDASSAPGGNKLQLYGETGKAKNETLNNVWKIGQAVSIWTHKDSNGQPAPIVLIGPSFGFLGNGSTLIAHEVTHILFQGNHLEVAAKLGLGSFPDTAKGNKDASDAINNYLNSDCGRKKKED